MGERGFAPILGTDRLCSDSLRKVWIGMDEPLEHSVGGSVVGMLWCSNEEALQSDLYPPPPHIFQFSQSASEAERSGKQSSQWFFRQMGFFCNNNKIIQC